jgi:hypothetical protein
MRTGQKDAPSRADEARGREAAPAAPVPVKPPKGEEEGRREPSRAGPAPAPRKPPRSDEERRREAAEAAKDPRRESGRPGGGKGRIDEPGRTHVYPASRPEGASGDATYHDEPSWGQGERGAAGYEDHGDSETDAAPAPGKKDYGEGV